MAKTDSKATFPADIDRDSFGHWLAGFTDGEGCFDLKISSQKYHSPSAVFQIVIRADEQPILAQIQSFLGVGRIRPSKKKIKSKPTMAFAVYNSHDLAKVVVPHFRKYSQHAKKAGAFRIWAEGVALLDLVHSRKPQGRATGGTKPKWSDDERSRFRRLRNALKEQRKFDSDICAAMPFSEVDSLPLFD